MPQLNFHASEDEEKEVMGQHWIITVDEVGEISQITQLVTLPETVVVSKENVIMHKIFLHGGSR